MASSSSMTRRPSITPQGSSPHTLWRGASSPKRVVPSLPTTSTLSAHLVNQGAKHQSCTCSGASCSLQRSRKSLRFRPKPVEPTGVRHGGSARVKAMRIGLAGSGAMGTAAIGLRNGEITGWSGHMAHTDLGSRGFFSELGIWWDRADNAEYINSFWCLMIDYTIYST